MSKLGTKLEIWADNATLALEDFSQNSAIANKYAVFSDAVKILAFVPYAALHTRYLFGRDELSNGPDAH